MTNNNFLPIIGLEVHVELKTKSKMFCGCDAVYFGHQPNTHCCPVCLGLPGALPVPNRKAAEWCVKMGLALGCQIPELSKFDRKNYFYPDLSKGYQLSQYDMPLAINGSLELKTETGKLKTIHIRRVHMEEDTGKLIHTDRGTLIDFNRSGVPLVEIVTEPDISSGQEAKVFLQKLQQIIRYLDISDADMEKGSMRLEPNISLKEGESKGLPAYKVEIKNINSFKFVEKAINFEIERQKDLLGRGEKVKQETRGWSETKNETLPRRSKEEAQDYRYFPEPDIPPIRFDKATITKLQATIPELPDQKLVRFMKNYGLGEYDVNILTTSLPLADYYEEACRSVDKKSFKEIANWLINKKIDISKISSKQLVTTILAKSNVGQLTDEVLEKIINGVLKANLKAVSDYKAGREQALMFLVGQVLKETKGQANAEKVKAIISKNLNV